MKVPLIKYTAIAFLLVSASSCSGIFWIFYKKNTYYKDYSDEKKLKFYSDNKAVIDSMVALSETKSLTDYVTLGRMEPGSNNFYYRSPHNIEPQFFDTTGIDRNNLWIKYLQRYPIAEAETRSLISRMMMLSGQLKPLFRDQFRLNNTRFLDNLVYIPLKKVRRDNEEGRYSYSYIIVFDNRITNKDSIQHALPAWYQLRQIGNNILTNQEERRRGY